MRSRIGVLFAFALVVLSATALAQSAGSGPLEPNPVGTIAAESLASGPLDPNPTGTIAAESLASGPLDPNPTGTVAADNLASGPLDPNPTGTVAAENLFFGPLDPNPVGTVGAVDGFESLAYAIAGGEEPATCPLLPCFRECRAQCGLLPPPQSDWCLEDCITGCQCACGGFCP